jgi:hypothetical protein
MERTTVEKNNIMGFLIGYFHAAVESYDTILTEICDDMRKYEGDRIIWSTLKQYALERKYAKNEVSKLLFEEVGLIPDEVETIEELTDERAYAWFEQLIQDVEAKCVEAPT